MALDPNIILSANRFDPVGAMSRGATAANQQNAFARQTAYDQAVTQNGAAALRGDANAQNALAGFDPEMVGNLQSNALTMQSTRQQMDVRSEELAMKREEARTRTMAELETKRGQIDMKKAAEEAAKTRDLLVRAGRFQSQGDEAGYNLFLQQNGVDPREYPMAEYRYIAATMEGVLDAVDAAVGPGAPDPTKGAPSGYMFTDPNNPAAGVAPLPGFTPKADVEVNLGGGKFDEEFAKTDAQALATISSTGVSARRNMGRIDQLSRVLSEAPSGAEAGLKKAAGEWGINTEGLDALQSAAAIINSLVPEQRQPGSGPMSDADLALFKESLPRLINQPGGNQTIIATMKAIAEYDAEGARIVQMARSGEIDRATAFDMLQNRANPLDGINVATPGAPPPSSTATPPAAGPKATDMSDEDFLKSLGFN